VLACYNGMVPHLCPEVGAEQAEALRFPEKIPLMLINVALENWRSIADSGIGGFYAPSGVLCNMGMDFPVSMGGYEYTRTPDDPCVLQMISCPYGETVGAPKEEQFAEARHRMLARTFDDYENEIRAHLGGMLPAGAFDFDRDVTSITVNRWAHGYTSAGSPESVRRGRQPFGRITVANTDSAAGSDAQLAIEMAHRAVEELG
jgi:spermidine dehydrogenase